MPVSEGAEHKLRLRVLRLFQDSYPVTFSPLKRSLSGSTLGDLRVGAYRTSSWTASMLVQVSVRGSEVLMPSLRM